jgi:hypothetical protein
MNKLIVEKIKKYIDITDLSLVSRFMDSQEFHKIDNQTWKEYTTETEVRFSIAYIADFLFLKYYVKEEEFKSVVRDINGEVHKDNCVEFFVSFDNNEYYNLEFNCLGNIKVGYGMEREKRKMLSEQFISKIEVYPSLISNQPKLNSFNWEILVLIPKELFCYSSITTFENLNCKANFYKCGDDLLKPHFLSWNKIETNTPDFHQPNFFGEVSFK